MAELPLITVITLCRDDAEVIEATIASVLEQEYPRLNYVVWDSGSTDKTLDVVRKYEERLTYWASESSHGTYDAMNKAAHKAVELAGIDDHWLFFLYAGDRFVDAETLRKVFTKDTLDYSCLKMIGGSIVKQKSKDADSITEAPKPIEVIPMEPAFTVASSFIRASVCHFDLDYPLGADYALQYKLYYGDGADSIASLDIPVIVTPAEDRDARLLNQRIIKGEYLGVQSQHISWRWVKEYFKWRFFG